MISVVKHDPRNILPLFPFPELGPQRQWENGIKFCWYIKALVDSDNNLLTLGTDSKLIGRIFELKSMVLLQEIAKEHEGYELVKPEAQTIYPDYLYICPDGTKIAVDIKTDYSGRSAHALKRVQRMEIAV